jgi:hypothetical protein
MTTIAIPPTTELFSLRQIVERHPHLFTHWRVEHALRKRNSNGLKPSVFETRSGELLLHEPGFLSWYLGLSGHAKPHAARRKKRAAQTCGARATA